MNHFEICFRKKYEFSMITPTELQELTLFLRLFVQFRKKEDEWKKLSSQRYTNHNRSFPLLYWNQEYQGILLLKDSTLEDATLLFCLCHCLNKMDLCKTCELQVQTQELTYTINQNIIIKTYLWTVNELIWIGAFWRVYL